MEAMNEIIFQDINDQYSYGLYMGITVMIMKSNGYINGTKLCVASKKDLFDWKRLKSTKEYIQYIENELTGENRSPLFITISDGDNEFRGTYLHKDLIVDLCSWISPEFKYKVQSIVNEYVIKQFRQEIDTINENYVVPPSDSKKQHIFFITREANNLYKVHRIQKERFKEDDNIIVSIDTPNAINLGVRLRERLQYKYNQFLLGDMTEQQLIEIVNDINEQKYIH